MTHVTHTILLKLTRPMCFGRGAEVVLPVEKLEKSEGFLKSLNGDVFLFTEAKCLTVGLEGI